MFSVKGAWVAAAKGKRSWVIAQRASFLFLFSVPNCQRLWHVEGWGPRRRPSEGRRGGTDSERPYRGGCALTSTVYRMQQLRLAAKLRLWCSLRAGWELNAGAREDGRQGRVTCDVRRATGSGMRARSAVGWDYGCLGCRGWRWDETSVQQAVWHTSQQRLWNQKAKGGSGAGGLAYTTGEAQDSSRGRGREEATVT